MNTLVKLGVCFIILALLELVFTALIVSERGGFGLHGGSFQLIGATLLVGLGLVFLVWGEDATS